PRSTLCPYTTLFRSIRAARRPSLSHSDPVHLLLAYTRETIDVHKPNLAQGAAIIYDDGFRVDAAALEAEGFVPIPAPLTKIAEEDRKSTRLNSSHVK